MKRIKCFRRMSGVALICLFLTLLAGCSTAPKVPIQSPPGTTTTIILVRHAERNLQEDQTESYLRPKGQARAQALVAAIGDIGVTAIYSTDLGRNRETAQPLADHLGLTVNLIPQWKILNPGGLAEDLVDEILAKHAGGVVVFVGNSSGNLQAVYRRLGGKGEPPTRHEDLYTVVLPDKGPVRITESTYGE